MKDNDAYISALLGEKHSLDQKVVAIHVFLQSDQAAGLKAPDKELLHEQKLLTTKLSNIIGRRLTRAGVTPPAAPTRRDLPPKTNRQKDNEQ